MTIGNRPPGPLVHACSSCYVVRPVTELLEVSDAWRLIPPRWACRPDAPRIARGDCLRRVLGPSPRWRLHAAATGERINREAIP